MEAGGKLCNPCEHPFQPGCYDMVVCKTSPLSNVLLSWIKFKYFNCIVLQYPGHHKLVYTILGILIFISVCFLLFCCSICCAIRGRKHYPKKTKPKKKKNSSYFTFKKVPVTKSVSVDVQSDLVKNRKSFFKRKFPRLLPTIPEEENEGTTETTSSQNISTFARFRRKYRSEYSQFWIL